MNKKDYESELKHIDKLEQKIAIKKANGLDTKEDEFETEIAMLELVEKMAEACKSRTISAEEFEAKRISSEIKKQSADSTQYSLLILEALNTCILDNSNTLQSKDISAIKHTCDLIESLTFEVYVVLDKYCRKSGIDAEIQISNLYEIYPIMEYTPREIPFNDGIHLACDILSLLLKLIEDTKTKIDQNNLGHVFTLLSVFVRYSSDLTYISGCFEIKEKDPTIT